MREIFEQFIHLKIPVYFLVILIIIFLLFVIGRRYRIRPKREPRQRNFKKIAKIAQIEGEDDFKEIVINAVHKAGFAYYEELFRNIREDIVFKVKGAKGKRYIIVAHYWPHDIRIHLPLEDIEKYFRQVQSSEIPYIIATNSLGIKEKAQDLLNQFNKRFEEPKLFFVSGSSVAEFIQKFKKIIGDVP